MKISPIDNIRSQQLMVGLLAFALGSGVYIILRERLYDLQPDLSTLIDPILLHRLRTLTWQLPSFFHALSFCMFLALVAGLPVRRQFKACIIWALIASFFEIMQRHNQVTIGHSSHVFHFVIPRLSGTYDPLDLVGTWMGSICAVLVLKLISRKPMSNSLSKDILRNFGIIAVLAAGIISLLASSPPEKPDPTHGNGGPVGPELKTICKDSDVPDGWIKVGDRWDPNQCGNPTNATDYNLWTIQHYSILPIDSFIKACSSAPTPNGWVVVNTSNDGSTCGHPTAQAPNVQNIKTIKRVK